MTLCRIPEFVFASLALKIGFLVLGIKIIRGLPRSMLLDEIINRSLHFLSINLLGINYCSALP